jgi:hypothetical protein
LMCRDTLRKLKKAISLNIEMAFSFSALYPL